MVSKTLQICEQYNLQVKNIKNTRKDPFKSEIRKKINTQHDKMIQNEAKEKKILLQCPEKELY